jgi:hypothetical protein
MDDRLQFLIRKPTAISTMASADARWAVKLQSDEFLRWGVGPDLNAGDIVAIYTPKGAKAMPDIDRGRIRHIFSVARPTYRESDDVLWRNVVWLTNRVTLPQPLEIDELKKPAVTSKWRLPNSNFRTVGTLRNPLNPTEAEVFWSIVLQKNANIANQIDQRLLSVAESPSLQPPEVKTDLQFEYDVAISFAGEDRPVAENIATECKYAGVNVFYDAFEEAKLWGKNLYHYLDDIYRNRARFCIVILSANYAAKTWTRHELESAQARAFIESEEYLLPLRLDDTEVPGVRGTVAYLDLRKFDISSVVRLLVQKLRGS